MRKINKKTKKSAHSDSKSTAPDKSWEAVGAPISKSEPAYININEHQAEIAAKSRLLWLIVAVFSVILAIFWLVLLRINIQKETADIGFSQIGEQIKDSLARFD